jgi:microcystin-dependent protein
MTDTATPRFGIARPKADRSDTADVPRDVRAVADAVEAQAARFGHGTFASRPAFGNQGSFFMATDMSPQTLFYDNGTGWITVGTVASGSVGSTQLADGAVITVKLADSSVTSVKIADGTIVAGDIADGTLTAAKFAAALKPSGGAGAATEALRALGTGAGLAAPGTHAPQHAAGGADPLAITLAMLDPAVTALLPQPGDMKIVAYDVQVGVNEPAGWLLSDGRSRLRTDDPNLFNKVGTTHGSVDGTHYNLPDMRGRTPVGKGTGPGLTARNVGQTFGEEGHVLSVGEMPSHNHGGATGGGSTGIESNDHTHAFSGSAGTFAGNGGSPTVGWPTWGTAGAGVQAANANFSGNTGGRSAVHTHSVPALAIGAQGGGAAHNVVQPSTVLAFLVKT